MNSFRAPEKKIYQNRLMHIHNDPVEFLRLSYPSSQQLTQQTNKHLSLPSTLEKNGEIQ